MRHPTPEHILEELANKAAQRIDGLAPVAFETAMEELVRYHRFLLAANQARDQDGQLVSLSEVSGTSWLPPHQEWIRQYRRPLERAAERLADDPDFVARMAQTPRHILPRNSEFELTAPVLQTILSLIPILVHRMEAWVTKRTAAKSPSDVHIAGQLSDSDGKAYAEGVGSIIGAWEALLQDATLIFGRDDQNSSSDERWETHRRRWPFLWQHLQDTAYLLAIAVWNEDRIGTDLYRDALIRWPFTYNSDVLDTSYILDARLTFPDVLSLGWENAVERVRATIPAHYPSPTPDDLFNTVLRQAHIDVVLLTAALLLFWNINGKQPSNICAETSSALLEKRLNDPDDPVASRPSNVSFKARFLDVARLAMAGGRHDRANYGSQLDRMVRHLDQMTERHVVSGRVYTPSTIDNRDELLISLLVILMAESPDTGDEGMAGTLRELAVQWHTLPNGDRSIRDLCRVLELFQSTMESGTDLGRALELLAPRKNYLIVDVQMPAIIRSAIAEIKAERTRQLINKPIDQEKLKRLRLSLETALFLPPAEIPLFRKFQVESKTGRLRVAPVPFTLMERFSKAQLVSPLMDNETGNPEAFSRSLCSGAAGLVWDSFRWRPRTLARINSAITDRAFWETVIGLKAQVGDDPVLATARAQSFTLGNLIHRIENENALPFVHEERRPDNIVGRYVATIEGIEVYDGRFKPGTAWLFSGRALQTLRYYAVNEDGHHVGLTFEPGSEIEGPLVASIMPVPEWSEDPIFELNFDSDSEGKPL
jgi:hypothetical protein